MECSRSKQDLFFFFACRTLTRPLQSNLGNAETDGLSKHLHFSGQEYSLLVLLFCKCFAVSFDSCQWYYGPVLLGDFLSVLLYLQKTTTRNTYILCQISRTHFSTFPSTC